MEILDGLKLLLIHHRIECDAFAFTKPNCSYHDLTFVLKGKLYYTVNGETYTISEGEAVYCPAGATMSREKSIKASYVSFNFTTKHNEPLPLSCHLTDTLSHEVRSYIEMINHLLRKPDIHHDEKLMNLINLILLRLFEQQESAHPLPYVDKIKAYIAENYQNDITLESVSSHVNLHPSYCSTIFKRNEGRSVTEYINNLRIQNAKELLESTQYRVGEIGNMVGISDPYYFSRVFSKICGISPSVYRKITNAYGGKYYSYQN